MNWREHISVSPNICHGKACFTGTRILVSSVLADLASGRSEEAIRSSYPALPPRAIQTALAYAAELSRERVVTLPPS